MRAVEFVDGTFTVTDVNDPPATGPGQLRIRVAACGICGSDLSMSKDPCRFVAVAAAGGFPLAVFDHDRPVVLGHEFAGTVVECGAGVTDFAIGDRVAGIGVATEGATGIPTIIGYSNDYHGAFGELIVVDAYWVRRVPDGLSLEHATLAEPLHVGELHVQQSGLTTADAALVIGCGSIGLGTTLAAKAHGAHTVIAVEPSPNGHGPYHETYDRVLQRLADGEIDADALITGRVGLDGVAEAFGALRNPDEHVKILVLPEA